MMSLSESCRVFLNINLVLKFDSNTPNTKLSGVLSDKYFRQTYRNRKHIDIYISGQRLSLFCNMNKSNIEEKKGNSFKIIKCKKLQFANKKRFDKKIIIKYAIIIHN